MRIIAFDIEVSPRSNRPISQADGLRHICLNINTCASARELFVSRCSRTRYGVRVQAVSCKHGTCHTFGICSPPQPCVASAKPRLLLSIQRDFLAGKVMHLTRADGAPDTDRPRPDCLSCPLESS